MSQQRQNPGKGYFGSSNVCAGLLELGDFRYSKESSFFIKKNWLYSVAGS